MTKYHFKDHKDFPSKRITKVSYTEDIYYDKGFNKCSEKCANLSIKLDEMKLYKKMIIWTMELVEQEGKGLDYIHTDIMIKFYAKALAANLPDLLKEGE